MMDEVLVTHEHLKERAKLNILAREYLKRGDFDLFHDLREQNPAWHPEFAGEDFSFANLAGLNLSGVWFGWANLTGANLKDANCSNANFMDANLENADCAGANFRWAHLDRTNFRGAIITRATQGLPIHLKRD